MSGGGGTVRMTTGSLAKTLESLPNILIAECRIVTSTGVCISLNADNGRDETKGSKEGCAE